MSQKKWGILGYSKLLWHFTSQELLRVRLTKVNGNFVSSSRTITWCNIFFFWRSLVILWWFTYPSPDPRPPSNRQARCGESSCIAPETAVGCPITRGATGHVRITIVKLQGSIRDIREAWVSLFLSGKEKPHLSRHKGNYETPGPAVEESRVFQVLNRFFCSFQASAKFFRPYKSQKNAKHGYFL